MLAYIATELHKPFIRIFFPTSDAEKQAAEGIIAKRLGFLADRLRGEYLFDRGFTVADAYLYVMLRWARAKKLDVPAPLAGLLRPDRGAAGRTARAQARGPLLTARLSQEAPMSLKLYCHPLASFCHKALIALYENETPFEPVIVDFSDQASSAAFRAVWPIAKMPVLRDEARDRTVAESTSSSSTWTRSTRARRAFCRPIPIAPGRRGCGTASLTTTSRSRCRRS